MRSPLLIFEWPTRHRIHLLLPATIMLAAILHAAIFFLFSVAYPNATSDGPNPAQVYFLPEGSPAKASLENLLLSSDPAFIAPGRGAIGMSELPPNDYVPQYAENRLSLTTMPPVIAKKNGSSSLPAEPVRIRSQAAREIPARELQRTRLIVAESIKQRIPTQPAGMEFRASRVLLPNNASFLVALAPDGSVPHVVMDQSSGDQLLDRDAMRFLRSQNFQPAGTNRMEWGVVEFHWGTDLKAEPAP